MLQQTRVDTVISYYLKFMESFPTLAALASASQQDVLLHWEGLGYYARARNMHKAAHIVVDELGGNFPDTYDEIIALPGIGPYTAAAIASLAFGKDHAVLDGNVMRVLTRWHADTKDIGQTKQKKALQALAQAYLPPGKAGRFNEAMMELGATVCTPRDPSCHTCPVAKECKGRETPEAFPVKQKKKPVPTVIVAAAVVHRADTVLIAQRLQTDMLGGLWEFPGGKLEANETLEACAKRELNEECGLEIEVLEERMVVHHSYSHFKLKMHVFDAKWISGEAQSLECADTAWVNIDRLREFPFSKADLWIIEDLQKLDSFSI